MNPALFLDRDGTLIEDPGYLGDPEGVRLLDGVSEALLNFSRAGFKLVVVSNQAGVARGFYSEAAVKKVNSRLDALLAEKGVTGLAHYHCPHHREGVVPEFAIDCSCRKPKPGLVFKARDELSLDLSRSILIGDKESDIKAARAAGIPRYALVTTGQGALNLEKVVAIPGTLIIPSLAEAARIFLEGA